MMEELPKFEVTDYAHLLDFLYRVIVPKLEGSSEITEIDEGDEIKEAKESYFGKSSHVKQLGLFGLEHYVKVEQSPGTSDQKNIVFKAY